MKIGIDISQIVYSGTGVASYVRDMVEALIRQAPQHEYVLFGASFRQKKKLVQFAAQIKKLNNRVKSVVVPIPPTILDILWNFFHIVPVIRFTGPLDIFWSSDWTQPPLGKTTGVTTIHDLSFLKYPESFDVRIRKTQKRRLFWAKRTCKAFFCDSEATKLDIIRYLEIAREKLFVIYPGYAGRIPLRHEAKKNP